MRSVGRIIPFLFVVLFTACGRQETATTSEQRQVTEPKQTVFRLTDLDDRTAIIRFYDRQLHSEHIPQPNILIYLFSSRDDLGKVMLPYLSRLQHQHARDLFVIGIMIPPDLDRDALRSFMKKNDTTFFISHSKDNQPFASALFRMVQWDTSYPLPTTFLFQDGHYVTHYEGITPIEMIQNDLSVSSTPSHPRKETPTHDRLSQKSVRQDR